MPHKTDLHYHSRKRDDNGLSLVEVMIAVVLVGIAFATWSQLAARSIKNGTFSKSLANTNSLCSEKALELAKRSDKFAQLIPKTSTAVGSIAPSPVQEGFFEELDRNGEVITPQKKNNTIVAYIRQFMIMKDYPVKDAVIVYVSVKDKTSNQILRVATAIKPDGIHPDGN
jgi:prepilin-type N-terminal cleavage/methylation domain-containing protein